ncbi:hypothetical protein M4Z11_05140, partial [Bartonella sp. G70]|nr:hypothetical protein [Bartonella sp. G70]
MKKNSTPNIIKAVSLGAVVSVLLSSTSPVFSANVAITGATNQSSNGPASAYPKGSHGSIVFSGDDDFCGVDNVVGRGGAQKPGTAITAEEQYERFINNETFSGRNPYGSSTKKVNWTGEGTTEGNVGYMGTATGGVANAMPEAFGVYSFATGCGSYASGNYSTAFGAGATAKAGGAQAFGVSSLATGEASVAMGVGTEATGKSAAAFGSLAKAEGLNSVALGTRAHAEGLNSVALGNKAHAYVEGAVAIGHDSVAGTTSSVAIGSGAQVTVESGVALGGNSVAVTPYGAAGYDPRVNGNSTIDDFVWKSTKGAVSVGNSQHGVTRQIVGVAAGTALSDAVNVAQLQALRDMILTGGNDLIQQDGSTGVITIGSGVNGDTIDIVNNEKQSRKISGVSGGEVAEHSTEAINGGQLWETNEKISELDTEIDNIETNITKIQTDVTKVATNTSQYFGGGANVLDGTAPTYTINGSQYNDVGSAFEGVDTTFTEINNKISNITENSLVQQDAAQDNLITIGAKTGGTVIDIKNSTADLRKIIGVKDGEISEQSTDAINGGQFWRIASNVSEYFGGGADVLGGKAPTYTINGSQYNDVGSAFKGVDTTFTEINHTISNITENSLVQQDSAQDDLITIGAETGGTLIDITNSEGEYRKITGVKDGDVSEQSVDAINGSQLWQVASNTSEYLGGGADVLGGKRPDYEIDGITYNDVGSAFEGIDVVFTEIRNEISGITENSLIQQDSTQDDLITIGAKTGGSVIDITNSEGEYRKITSVRDGDVSEQSVDAINGSQLWQVASNTSEYFGGGADVLSGKAPTYTINGSQYNDVGSAFEGVDTTFTEINNKISNITENSLVQQDSAQDNIITIGAETSGIEIHVLNNEGKRRRIVGVLGGAITKGSSEVVNGGQLWETEQVIEELGYNTSKYLGGGADVLAGT